MNGRYNLTTLLFVDIIRDAIRLRCQKLMTLHR